MIEEFLFNYCPWLNRVRLILCWLGEIVQDQVNPGLSTFLHHPTNLWPGWDWAQKSAIYSSRNSPWHSSWLFSAYDGLHAEDDEYDYGDECVNNDDDDDYCFED